MTESDSVFSGSIPELYDTYLVPLIFESFAEDLAERVAVLSPKSVLETAAGSGVVTRALAPRIRSAERYVVTDLNPEMLNHAEDAQDPQHRIAWRQANALELPFDDDSFDAVCCQFGVMFFPDRVAGYAEARRVLKPGGRFVFNVWDRIEENEFAKLVHDAAAGTFPDDPPQFLARTPYGYHDLAIVEQELHEANFTEVSVVTVQETSRAPSPRHPAVALCHGTPLRNEIELRDKNGLDVVTDRATEAIARRYGAGHVAGRIQAHVIVAAP